MLSEKASVPSFCSHCRIRGTRTVTGARQAPIQDACVWMREHLKPDESQDCLQAYHTHLKSLLVLLLQLLLRLLRLLH